MSEDEFIPKVLILYSELEKLKKLAALGRKTNQEGFGMEEIPNIRDEEDSDKASPQIAKIESEAGEQACDEKSEDDSCPEIEVSEEDSEKAEKLLSALCKESSIEWSSIGEISIDGKKISGSSLALLVEALFRKDPVGLVEFKNKLTSLGLLNESK